MAENTTRFKINDLVEYYNPRAGRFQCWVTNVHAKDETGKEYVDLKSLEQSYNIMSVPEDYVTLIKRYENNENS